VSLPQVVRRYAAALFEVARETNRWPEVEADMRTLDRIFSELPEVLDWCRRSHETSGSTEAFVDAAFRPHVGELTANTLDLAARHGRLPAIPLLPEAMRILSDSASNLVPVLLETTQDFDPELVAGVESFIGQKTGKRAVVRCEVHPELGGGFRIHWEDKLIDKSAREKLRRLRSLLTSAG
jgi:F-type H+-transporting ATPase subunit delta